MCILQLHALVNPSNKTKFFLHNSIKVNLCLLKLVQIWNIHVHVLDSSRCVLDHNRVFQVTRVHVHVKTVVPHMKNLTSWHSDWISCI